MSLQTKANKRYLNLYFQVHQPRRLGQFSFFDIGTGRDYFDDDHNQIIMHRVAKDCYQPANLLLLKLIHKHPGIKVTFSISGSALRQMEVFAPAALESFYILAATGAVEFLSETYYHSLSCLKSKREFYAQIKMHDDKIHKLFGVRPVVFRNTELIYNDEIGRLIQGLGFKGIVTDGIERILHGRSPNRLHQHPEKNLSIFLRNYRLSDDIAFRFMQKNWSEWPLTPTKLVAKLDAMQATENLVTIGLDYETFGEHLKASTGIFQFLEGMLAKVAKHKTLEMVTPSQAISLIKPLDVLNVPESISWADENRDLSAWLGNGMQQDAFGSLIKMEAKINKTGDPRLLNTWRYLQTSDHFYYMSTKDGDDRGIHDYFSPYASPYEAFMNYMNVLSDLELQIENRVRDQVHSEYAKKTEFLTPDELKKLCNDQSKWKPETLTF